MMSLLSNLWLYPRLRALGCYLSPLPSHLYYFLAPTPPSILFLLHLHLRIWVLLVVKEFHLPNLPPCHKATADRLSATECHQLTLQWVWPTPAQIDPSQSRLFLWRYTRPQSLAGLLVAVAISFSTLTLSHRFLLLPMSCRWTSTSSYTDFSPCFIRLVSSGLIYRSHGSFSQLI